MKIETLLNPSDRQRISQAISQAESKTTGEIVPVIVARSDLYPGARWRLAILVVLVGSLAIYFGARDWFTRFPLAVVFGLVLGGDLLGHFMPLRRLTLNDKETAKEVFERALAEFQCHKLTHTQERTGIMIFVSLFEHRVVVLADEGINTKVKVGTWEQLIDEFIGALKKKHLVDGFVTAISQCGAILAEHLPAGAKNKNELSNELIIKND